MKAQFLKLAGVKDEMEFYKKFPTQKSFMAKYGKQIKKAQFGNDINSNSIPDLLENYNPNNYTGTGNTNQQFGSGIPQPSTTPLPRYGAPANEPIFDPSSVITPYNSGVNVNQNKQIVGEEALPVYQPMGEDKVGSMLSGMAGPAGKILGGIAALEGEKQKRRQAVQMKKVSEVSLLASTTRPEQIERDYVRPEDNIFATNQFFPANGMGTNVLAKNGANVKKAQEGLSFIGHSGGGGMAFDSGSGFGNFMNNGNGQVFGQLADYATGNNAGGQIGGGIGEGIGMAIGGPMGGQLGNIAGTLIGGSLDNNAKRTKKAQEATQRNIMNMALNNYAPNIQAGYASHLEDGGSIPNYNMGGDLETYDDGGAHPVSYNPYLPEGGETVMFKGPSHDNGGIDMSYGGQQVEVEGGEPAVQLPDGDGVNLTVFGNLPITAEYSSILGDKNASGKKFKNYINELSKKENKQNILINKTTEELDDLNVITSFDKLKLSTLQANLTGADMTLKSIADKKMNAALLQKAINETAEEEGLSAEHLAKGKVRKARNGTSMKAQNGLSTDPGMELYYKTLGRTPGMIDYNTPETQTNPIFKGDSYVNTWMPKVFRALSDPATAAPIIDRIENYNGQDSADVRSALTARGTTFNDKVNRTGELMSDSLIGPYHNLVDLGRARRNNLLVAPAANIPADTTPAPLDGVETPFDRVGYKRNKLMDIYNMALPYLRPTDQEPLDANQLSGEMFALSNNQVDPVQAQTYTPDLSTPYDISYQDVLNANQSDYKNTEKLVANNPAALAILNANKYSANQKVLGEQFRTNQAMRDKVFGENRNTLNDAKLKNLSIYDTQYQRQSQAVSKTKATTQAALNSISDKYAKNKLENRTLGVYENLYNYRYDDSGRAINMNPLFQADIPNVGADNTNPIAGPNGTLLYPQYKNGKFVGYLPANKATTTGKNIPSNATPPYVATNDSGKYGASIAKAMKNL